MSRQKQFEYGLRDSDKHGSGRKERGDFMKNESKQGHTAEPWGVGIEPQMVMGESGKAICRTGYNTNAETIANAALIAAAPDMLAALKKLFYTVAPDGKPCESVFDEALAQAAKAIDKAEGKGSL